MQSILQQAKSDPAALSDHMKNQDIKLKVSLFQLPPLSYITDSLQRLRN